MSRYKKAGHEEAVNETRRKLLVAAATEFSLLGYENANINHISAAAGFAKGTIYNYFPSKQALLLSIISEVGTLHNDYLAEQVRQDTGALRRLERFFEAGFEFFGTHPIEMQLLVTTLYGAQIEFKAHVYRVYEPMFRLVSEEILSPGMTQGIFAPADPAGMATLIMTIYLGTSPRMNANGKIWLDPRQVSSFVLNALQNPGTVAGRER